MKKQKGFTLIELLVVIAIIGILAAVLMVNLSGTRNKAKDSAIKLEMGQIRTAMETYALGAGTYVGGYASTEVTALASGITGNGGTIATPPTYTTSQWCVSVALNDASLWCVDATGYAGVPTAAGTCATSVVCK